MPVLAVLLILTTQAGPVESVLSAVAKSGYRPSGSPIELHDLSLLSRLRHPGVRTLGFSSYDRSGGNDDGFNGTYSKIRDEQGNSVLAEVSGPGVIQRIWFTHTSGDRPGLLDRKGEHLRIFVDGKARPALDIPLETLFSGNHPHFPRPLVSEGSGGFVSYVPVPFRKGCKVVVDGLGVRFYQITLIKLPGDEGVTSFTEQPNQEARAALERAVQLWSRPESYIERDLAGAKLATYAVDGLARSAHLFAMPPGPATIRSIELDPVQETIEGWRTARIRIIWEGDDSADAGVDLPLEFLFGSVGQADSYQSLLVGQPRGGAWYNRFPMPYHRQAILRIDSEKPIRGVIRVRFLSTVDPDAGYLRATFRQALPPRPREDFRWLDERGRGHFAGILMTTRGKARLPFWLEGDDKFTIDGRLAIHGTGTEDYFNCGWYALKGRLDGPASYPLHGFPVYRNDGEFWDVVAFRWHLADPVPFSRSVVAGIEHGGDNTVPAEYRAAVFWYSQWPGPARTGP